MINTLASLDVRKTQSKKRLDAVMVRLPMIKIEVEHNSAKPRVFRRSFKNIRKSVERSAIKVKDLTDKVIKDLPKGFAKNIVVSPKMTSKILNSISKEKKSRKIELFKPRKSHFESFFKNLEHVQEYRRKVNGSLGVRTVSPGLAKENL